MCPKTFFDECSNKTTLGAVDIVFLNSETDKVNLAIEIEESGADPKKIIGDIASMMLSERIRISGREYGYEDLTFIMASTVNSNGSSGDKIKLLCERLSDIDEELDNRKMEIKQVVDGEIEVLLEKVRESIEDSNAITGQNVNPD